jgi:hypothetical protein
MTTVQILKARIEYARARRKELEALRIVNKDTKEDGEEWIHLSIILCNSYEELLQIEEKMVA